MQAGNGPSSTTIMAQMLATTICFKLIDGGGWIFTDNSSDNTWNITETDAANHIFSIQVSSSAGYFNASQFLGAIASRTTNKGIATSVRYNVTTIDDSIKWKFISQAHYHLYEALLYIYMIYAKLRGGY